MESFQKILHKARGIKKDRPLTRNKGHIKTSREGMEERESTQTHRDLWEETKEVWVESSGL
jgi:hypothetical protein